VDVFVDASLLAHRAFAASRYFGTPEIAVRSVAAQTVQGVSMVSSLSIALALAGQKTEGIKTKLYGMLREEGRGSIFESSPFRWK
jgi:hypothetical protein